MKNWKFWSHALIQQIVSSSDGWKGFDSVLLEVYYGYNICEQVPIDDHPLELQLRDASCIRPFLWPLTDGPTLAEEWIPLLCIIKLKQKKTEKVIRNSGY